MTRLSIVAGVAILVLAGSGCDPKRPATRTASAKSGSQKKQDEARTKLAVKLSPPKAVPPAPAPTRNPYRTDTNVVISERVTSSIPHQTEAEADNDVFAIAADLLEQKLLELDPPIVFRPTPNEVRNEFVRYNSRTVFPPDEDKRLELEAFGIDANRVYVAYQVEVSAEQIRDLRTGERVTQGLRMIGGLTAAAIAGFLFLRLDERTKGYLTRWLAVGAVTLAAGAAITMYLL